MLGFIGLAGTIFIAVNGGGVFEILVYWAICGSVLAKHTDKNRREKWWN